MNGGEVSDGKGSAVHGSSYGEVGGIGVFNGGRAIINDGLITRNTGFAGGLQAWTWNMNAPAEKLRQVHLTERSYIDINGGGRSPGIQLVSQVEESRSGAMQR